MKSYYVHKKLFLIGKGWEIRHHLRNMLALENRNITLAQYLNSHEFSAAAARNISEPSLH